MAKPIAIIEDTARGITRSADVLIFAFEGLLEKTLRDTPSIYGVNTFNQVTNQMMQDGLQVIDGKLLVGNEALKQTLSDSERSLLEQLHDDMQLSGDAYSAIGAAFQQARIAYVKTLRDHVAAKTFGTAGNSNRIMTRSGRRYRISDYVYLTIRKLLMDHYNLVKVAHINQSGFDSFTLDTDKLELIGVVFKVEDYPSMDKYFHHRSNNLVGAAHVSP